MTRSHLAKSAVVLITALCCSMLSAAQEYVVVVRGQTVRYTARPERGYVVQSPSEGAELTTLVEPDRAMPIPGSVRRGLGAVRNDGPEARNEQAMAQIRALGRATYVAPLFSVNDQTVAIIPEIVVRLEAGTDLQQIQSLCQATGCAIKKAMDFTEQEYLLAVLHPNVQAVFDVVDALNREPLVEWAAPNQALAFRPCEQIIPNDEYFNEQWHLDNTGQTNGTPGADINAPEAWELETGDPNIVVAVLDTGVDATHPDLIDNLIAGYDFHEDDDSPDPRGDGHGTSVAGIIAASGNNALGVTGVAWRCSIMPVRTNIWADWGLVPESEVATAIRWAAVNGADILNNSWAENIPIPIVHSAIVDITKPGGIGRDGKGCVFVVAAGNENGPIYWPALYPEVITVGATTHRDQLAGFSSYGPEVDVVAPGQNILTTDIVDGAASVAGYTWGDYFPWFTGTSASCPVVSGVAALILSVDPNLTNEEVRLILRRSAHDLGEPGRDDLYGWGRVDARAAVEMALIGLEPWYVDDNAPNDPGPGDPNFSDPAEDGSAVHPFDTIQEAIEAAANAETIVILPGRYAGLGNRDIDFRGKAVTVRSATGAADCIIDCQGQGQGFRFHVDEGPRSILEGVTVTGAVAQKGAAVLVKNSSPTIRNCVFTNNQASLTGGAIAVIGQSAPLITGSVFAWNTAAAAGGAIGVESGAPVIRNCTIVRNKATTGGTGLWTQEDSPAVLTNCVLWDNGPGPILGNPSVSYCTVQGAWPGPGNIEADPLFADPNAGDFHLRSEAGRWDPRTAMWVQDDVTSPCIDAGDPSTPPGAEPEPNGGLINQGAYGGTAQASLSTNG